MDGKQYFRKCCQKLEIDCDTFIRLGAGAPKNPTRFIYQDDYTKRKDTQLFAIKYFAKEDLYVAWNLKEPKARTKNTFSLSKQKAAPLKKNQVLSISKGIEYINWDVENTFVFRPDAVVHFLKAYVVSRT